MTRCDRCGRFARYDAYPRAAWWCDHCERRVKTEPSVAEKPVRIATGARIRDTGLGLGSVLIGGKP